MKSAIDRNGVLTLIKSLSGDDGTAEDVAQNLTHPVASVRAAAVRAVGRRYAGRDGWLPALEAAYRAAENQAAVWGKLKIAHLALDAIARVDPVRGGALIERLTEGCAEDRQFIQLYLRNGSSGGEAVGGRGVALSKAV